MEVMLVETVKEPLWVTVPPLRVRERAVMPMAGTDTLLASTTASSALEDQEVRPPLHALLVPQLAATIKYQSHRQRNQTPHNASF